MAFDRLRSRRVKVPEPVVDGEETVGLSWDQSRSWEAARRTASGIRCSSLLDLGGIEGVIARVTVARSE